MRGDLTSTREVPLNEKRTMIVLAAAAGILAGVAACNAQQPTPLAPGAPSRTATSDGDRADGGRELHGCGQHDGDSCGAHDDDKH